MEYGGADDGAAGDGADRRAGLAVREDHAGLAHWYCLRKDAAEPGGFAALARHIVEAGYLAEFRAERREAWAVRRYLDVGDFHYWIMDDTPAKATLINRAQHPNAAVRL